MQNITILCHVVGVAVDDGTTTIRLQTGDDALANIMTPAVPVLPLKVPYALQISFPSEGESVPPAQPGEVKVMALVDGIERVKGGPDGDGPDRALLNARHEGEHAAQVLLDPELAKGIAWDTPVLFVIAPA